MTHYPKLASNTDYGVGLFNPSDFTVASGGSVTLNNSSTNSTKISTTTISSAVASCTLSLTGGYPAYLLRYISLLSASGLNIVLSTNGGTSYLSSYMFSRVTTFSNKSSIASIAFTPTQGTLAPVSGEMYLFNSLAGAGCCSTVWSQFSCYNSSSARAGNIQAFTTNTISTAVNAMKFYPSSGTITGGTFILYGLSNI